MAMDNPNYDLYIWASYAVTAILMGGICAISLLRYVRLRRYMATRASK